MPRRTGICETTEFPEGERLHLLSGTRRHDKQSGRVRSRRNWIGGTRRGNARFVPPSSNILFLALALVLTNPPAVRSTEPAEPLLREVPPGVFVESSVEIPAAQVKAISQKLGGQIQRLTNSIVRIHGHSIQVNVITAVDEANANALQAALGKMKQEPFVTRSGRLVVEYVGRHIDAPLAIKASYELGLQDKPTRVRYRVIAEVATVEKADYMACTPLLNQFLALDGDANQDAADEIKTLTAGFTFGRTLVLRNPALDGAEHAFQPIAIDAQASGATIAYSFAKPETRQGVPFVTGTLDITVGATAFHRSPTPPPEHLTAATPFWPVDDPQVSQLAQRITAGKATRDEKVMAILQWLSPGRNLKYSGETGSRWGTLQVLEQGFGHCWDFSDCFITLARAAEVPSRQVAGWLYGASGHVWAEVYSETGGWQQVDPTGGGQLPCGIYHIPWFTSEDGEMPVVYVSKPVIEIVETE